MFDVITIGAATRDIFVKSAAFEIREHDDSPTGLENCMPLGTKIELDGLVFETGGGATNAATTFSRLGFRAACISATGDDIGAAQIKDALRKDGCSVSLMQKKTGMMTGHSIIILAGSGERTILVYRGASAGIDTEKIRWNRLWPKWFYVSSLGGDMALLRRALSHANDRGIRVAWNPGAKEIEGGLAVVEPLIRSCDVINLNLEEASALVGAKDIPAIMHALSPLVRRAVIITDGKRGAYAQGKEGTFKSGIIDVPRINVTGAGDAFGSGLVAGLMKKDDLRYALAIGTWNATGVVQQMGAKLGIIRKFPAAADIDAVPIEEFHV